MIPRIMQAKPEDYLTADGTNLDPFKLWDLMLTNEKPGGHGERSVAVGTIDMAIWDAVAKIEEKPLYKLLSERYGDGHPDDKVFVYAAGGYYQPGKDDTMLQKELKSYLDLGYSVVKMKIGNSLEEDQRRIEAALKVVPSGQHLAVDANGRLDLPTAIKYADMLAPYDLFWYEEPGDTLDFQLQNTLSRYYSQTMATGENLFSMQDARNLIRYGGMRPDKDYLQFDCALSYGLVEYMKTLKMLKENGWSSRRCIPHGGHQMSLNIAAGLKLGGNESYPGIFEPFGGFADDEPIEDGYVKLPQVPGIGFETKAKLMKVLRDVAAS
ncbi:enolase C-terminal domain-like protein [Levilactobacillus suantsaii]|uniref:enolase C-terminal domain-like protein n=1 Tax=Levilactobacillus suantsaii TaxID=2292255 RepID=UPI002D7F363A|nr:enolase C-terminal domain-like protein [Levilactobacillus suantsaii]